MSIYWQGDGITLHLGDCREITDCDECGRQPEKLSTEFGIIKRTGERP